MAKALAYVSGTALAPGVSRNKNLYTREAIAGAVRRAQQRIAEGKRPIGMYTYHETTNTRELVGAVTKMWQEEDGSARYVAAIADTGTGRDIANLVNPEGDEPAFLRGVSIRGNWVGAPRRERAPDGNLVEAGSDLEIGRLDWTSEPGVDAAGVDSFRYAETGGGESGERYTISESAPEALVETAITEETTRVPPAVFREPDGIREALRSMLGDHVAEATPAMSKRVSGLSDEKGRVYADPGYQPDKKQRYDISSAKTAKAAWSYISQADNAKAYTPNQLKRIKGRIKSALGKFGVTVAAEGWTVDPAVLVTEAIAEYAGMGPECAGSYSLSATNGPTTVTVCSYGLDPADLQAILAQACKGAGLALSTLDPDMDADIDLPGEQESAEDPDALAEEAGAPDAVTETAPVETPAPEPAADREGTEVLAMSETTTTEAVAPATAAAPSVTVPEDLVRKYEKKLAKKEAARRLAAGAPAESAAEAPAPSAVTETDDARIARIVEERLAAARAETPAAPAVTETEDQRINRIVEERLVRERQELTASGGGPGRKGLVTEHSAAAAAGEIPPDFPMRDGAMKPMEEWSDLERRAVGRQLESYVLGSRASQ